MTPPHYYWLNYGLNIGGQTAEASREVGFPEPITQGWQLEAAAQDLVNRELGGRADAVASVRHWQFLREEPDE